MNTPLEKFTAAIRHDWYIQGFSGYPVFLNHCAYSGITMKKELGYGYTHFLFKNQNEYGEMWYRTDDLRTMWKVIKRKLRKDPKYLYAVRASYNKNYKRHEKLLLALTPAVLRKSSEEEVLRTLRECGRTQTFSVGCGHCIESIGVELEKEFKHHLARETRLSGSAFNRLFSSLTAPSSPSFLIQEESDLARIAKLPSGDRRNALHRHAQKYSWITNSYAGGYTLTEKDFSRRMRKPLVVWKNPLRARRELIRRYRLSAELQREIQIIDFATVWQDERKANILRMIGYFEMILAEIVRRYGLERRVLCYLGVHDIARLFSVADLARIYPELKKRSRGVFFLQNRSGEYAVSGKEFERLVALKKEEHDSSSRELRGSVAHPGTAAGRVVICKGIESIKKVGEGDILVTSMTRPEFMPALKKCAGIITDEGGITCHAAIVARELGIPAIIGTKIATRVLRAGMSVEVRANHGVVRILS